MDQRIVDAITQKKMVEFEYHNKHRVAEPHIYGVKAGVEQMLTWQTEGESVSGGLPDWRRVDVADIKDLRVLDESFPGPRDNPSGKHTEWDETFAIVK